MNEQKKNAFISAAKIFLSTVSLEKLRSYGRSIGVASATAKKKSVLIEDIIGVLVGEIPAIEISKRGAPVKNGDVDVRVESEMTRLQDLYLRAEDGYPVFDFETEYKKMLENPTRLTVEDPIGNKVIMDGDRIAIFEGQLQTLNGASMLLPLNCVAMDEKIVVPVVLIKMHDLREGDVITTHATKTENVIVATNILTVNGKKLSELRRLKFDEADVCYPRTRINTYDGGYFSSVTAKYVDWLIPLSKGQRGLVISAPKAGKTEFFAELVQAFTVLNTNTVVFGLLVDESPETVTLFRKLLPEGHCVYSTYEDDAERQVFIADFILKRAKRYAESGKDVILFVDSFNALARAYNDTDESAGGKMLPCGLESKTVYYLKKYFGAARCFAKGGSLTLLGAVSVDTGNPADDVIGAELRTLSNLQIRLSSEMASKHLFPALDLRNVYADREEELFLEKEREMVWIMRGEVIPKYGAGIVLDWLEEADSKKTFFNKILCLLNK